MGRQPCLLRSGTVLDRWLNKKRPSAGNDASGRVIVSDFGQMMVSLSLRRYAPSVSKLSGLSYVLLTLGVAIIAAGGTLLGHWGARRGMKETDKRWHRERLFELMDKAIARALSTNIREAQVGIAQLEALAESQLLQPEDDDLLDAVTGAVLADTLEGDAPDVVIVDEPEAGR